MNRLAVVLIVVLTALQISLAGSAAWIWLHPEKFQTHFLSVGTMSVSGTLESKTYTTRCFNEDLNKIFASYNRRYFEGKLPNPILHFADGGKEWSGRYTGSVDQIEIDQLTYSESLSKNSCESLYGDTLLHEMAHEFVAHNYDMMEKHGEHWKAKMRALAGDGAFDEKLWTKESNP